MARDKGITTPEANDESAESMASTIEHIASISPDLLKQLGKSQITRFLTPFEVNGFPPAKFTDPANKNMMETFDRGDIDQLDPKILKRIIDNDIALHNGQIQAIDVIKQLKDVKVPDKIRKEFTSKQEEDYKAIEQKRAVSSELKAKGNVR